jgi:tetratricopeptide (TPR) repeat protein
MDRNRLRAYMTLIRELLRCPSGEELALLQANMELVDTNLITLMEKAATRATEKGALGTADFLRNMASQLNDMLTPEVQTDAEGEETVFSTYMQLVEALLNCPNGTEAEILHAHQHLIDTRLVLTLQQFATMLVDIGENQAADFLRSIAAPLTEALSNSGSSFIPTEYLDFLGDILRATSGSNGDAQVVYDLLEANLDKVNIELAQALDDWATSTLTVVKPQIAQSIGADIVNFSTLIEKFPGGSQEHNLEIAIAGYEVALRAFRRDKSPRKWAEIQNHLGYIYSKRLFGEKAMNLEVAIECFRAALEVFEESKFTAEWGATLNYLGVAYQNRIMGDKTNNLQIASQYFDAADKILDNLPG